MPFDLFDTECSPLLPSKIAAYNQLMVPKDFDDMNIP